MQAQLKEWLDWMIDADYYMARNDYDKVEDTFRRLLNDIGANWVHLDILTAAVELLWKTGYRDGFQSFKSWMQKYQWQVRLLLLGQTDLRRHLIVWLIRSPLQSVPMLLGFVCLKATSHCCHRSEVTHVASSMGQHA